MLKRFIAAMLGSLAAIWISVFLILILSILFIAAIVSNSFSSTSISYKEHTVLHLELEGSFIERSENSDILLMLYDTNEKSITLNNTLSAINTAIDDDKIEGIFIECKGSNGGLAQRVELNEAINKFKESGKWVVAYADNYAQGDYFNASCATEIFLNPVGMIDIHGLSATTLFYKGLLDKLGVEMQIIKVGTFKSAVEPFILDKASEANKLQQQVFLTNIWDYIATAISNKRNISVNEINQSADSMMLTYAPGEYKNLNFIDDLKYRHEVIEYLKEKVGINADDKISMITPDNYMQVADAPHSKRQKNKIAVLYATGDIVDNGRGGIVASKLVPQILKLKEDKEINGLILRVNSGGGSAFASEQIWEALEQFKTTGRPFYVSMSDYAASGGYYISSGADVIYAEPVTLTGSIGIFGMIPCAKELMNNKLGITTDNVSTNTNGAFPTIDAPMTSFQRESMQREINRGYETFVSRCAQGRGMSVDSIKAIAEGRVWDGLSAKQIGLVDRLGSLSTAISDMAEALDFENKYCIVEYPNSQTTFLEALSATEQSVKEHIVKESIGDSYEILKNIEYIKQASPMQCRMEYMIVQ